jgi:RNA polymerase sigma-B factor
MEDRYDLEALVEKHLRQPSDEGRERILQRARPIVERLARRFSGVEAMEDLVQVGFIGLLNALSKYDPSAGVRFSTYATHLITGEIRHHLRDRVQTIRHPAWMQELRHRVQKASLALQVELGRQPETEEIAIRAGVPEHQVRDALLSLETLRVASLDASPNDSEDSDSDIERLDQADFESPTASVEDRMLITHAISQLRELEQQVLVLFHFESRTQTEIAAELGISSNYVSHILRQSLSKMRRFLLDEETDERRTRAKRGDSGSIDAETALYNAAFFGRRLQEEVHRATCGQDPVALTLYELDGLSAVRSFFGEEEAKEIIADAGEMLRGSVRSLDLVCRRSGGAFAVIMPATGHLAEQAHDRLRSELDRWLRQRFGPTDKLRFVSGWAVAPDDGSNSEAILSAAEGRMRQERPSRAA